MPLYLWSDHTLFVLKPIFNPQASNFKPTGNKVSVAEPHNLVDAVKEVLKEKKSIEGSPPEDDDLKESRSKG